MRAGAMDRLVELRHRALAAPDANGQRVESWPTAYATVWAKKRDVTARERFAAQQVQAELETVFEIRWRSDVEGTDRLVCDGVTYNIRPGREIGRRQGLELLATRIQNG